MELNLEVLAYEDFPLKNLAPSKGNLSRAVNPQTVAYTFGDSYRQNRFFPAEIAAAGEPYILRDVRGLDYARIADALGVPVGTVKSRLFRARAALREAMEEAQSEMTAEQHSGSTSQEHGRRAGSGSDPEKGGSDRDRTGQHGPAQDRPGANPGRSVG
jgi:hypothetical protein